MSNYFRNQTDMAHEQTIRNGIDIVRSLSERRRQNDLNQRIASLHDQALENAKRSGVFPDDLQRTVPVDWMGSQAAIKVLALRELAKYAPNHPLVVSQKCREMVAKVTVMNFCRAGRPRDVFYTNFVPTDQVAEHIYRDFPKD